MKKIIFIGIVLFFSFGCANKKNAVATDNSSATWATTWATAPQLVEPNNNPPAPGLTNNTLRQTVRVSIGGEVLRVRFSNAFSKSDVTMKKVIIALSAGESNIVPDTRKALTFNGSESYTIPAGGEVYSDAVPFKFAPSARLSITIAFGATSPDVTGHPGSRTTSYIVTGDDVAADNMTEAVKTDHWYVIQSIETMGKAATVVVLGNSITDGRGSTTNQQNRWTDVFSERLLANPATAHIGVANMGIGGNCVLRGGLGPTALDRFDRDVLSHSGVKWLLILEGVNDLGGVRDEAAAERVSSGLIEAYTTMTEKAHSHGIKVYGCPILPYGKSFYDNPFSRAAKEKVNEWIRTTSVFDAVIDLDKSIASKDDAAVITEGLHDGDLLHPSAAGHKAIGEAVPLKLFE